MAQGHAGLVLRHLRELLDRPPAGDTRDSQLLQDFCARQDQTAFAGLVRRHGPMVLRVCRRVLHHEQDAEDAFQATLLVLARKAEAIRRRECLGAWLYEVAYHVALKARTQAARRREHERRAGEMRGADGNPEDARQELRPLLDEELQRLPPRYRRLLVLCDLQGPDSPEDERAPRPGWIEGPGKGAA
jgi:RNA polymerase sigma factor (sigma-70 family)